jgi:predicted ATPase
MSESPKAPRPLHLQTIDSLFAELIGGGKVLVGENGETFGLESPDSRAIVNWYRVNRSKWAGNVMTPDVEAIASALLAPIPSLAIPELGTIGTQRRLRLTKLVAHRFGGIHAYGTFEAPPDDFVFEPREPITLFEGWNGAGKTSLLNAVIWCLTGQILRPQRPPESTDAEFDSHYARNTGENIEMTAHGLTPITPLPNPAHFMPAIGKAVPLDSWVELTFVDQNDNVLPPVRRTQVRNARGKVTESEDGFSALGVDPIALKTGTTMPALLAFIKVGGTSELGTAAAKLTGLADISSLAKHATKAGEKLKGELRKAREDEIETADQRYLEALTDLQTQIDQYADMKPADPLPAPSAAKDLEEKLRSLESHFTGLKAEALKSAQTILGAGFDPTDESARDELEACIAPALLQLKSLVQLPSTRRLKSLSDVTPEQWQAWDELVRQMRLEADALAELATAPELGRRKQLYARVSSWIAEAGGHDFSKCDVCSRSLDGIVDPVTKKPVSDHLAEVTQRDRELLALTQQKWAKAWSDRLAANCPPGLEAELKLDLPDHPRVLLRKMFVDDLFATGSFAGILAPLQTSVGDLCDQELQSLPPLGEPTVTPLAPVMGAVLGPLMTVLQRMARAKAFAEWRASNDGVVSKAFKTILRGPDGDTSSIVNATAIGRKLTTLESIVKGVAPLNLALDYCKRVDTQLKVRRSKEEKLALYARAVTALGSVIQLGDLADVQVETLRKLLHARANYWRDRCYSNAYAQAGHALRDTSLDIKGVLEIRVGSELANAPAQHISNASALRASLMGFFLAFWEHVLKEHGGLTLLTLDDPQELLDHDNRDKLARLLTELVGEGAQLIVATYDRHFAREVAHVGRAQNVSVEHLSVHPVNANRAVLYVAAAMEDLDRKRDAYEKDKDNAVLAQDYAGQVRVFVEARLGDIFDDPAYPAYSTGTKKPTLGDHLGRLRGLVKTGSNALFKSRTVADFCACRALAQGSACMKVLNTPHHDKASLSAGEVSAVAADLDLVRRLAEKMHTDFRLWRWREPLADSTAVSNVVPFKPATVPTFKTVIHPDLAAFTAHAAHEATQDTGSDILTESWFADKALFYIRTDNFGFALPSGCIAIVENLPYEGRDHNLVIARHGDNVLARRLFRPPKGNQLSLAAEAPDPRNSKPTLVFDAADVLVYRIVGMLTEQPASPFGKGEAIEIPSAVSLMRIKTAYKVREDSGIPLALPGQIVLGGEAITANQLAGLEGKLIALTLRDGTSVFKRVGTPVSGTNGRLMQFESIGGLGSSLVVSIDIDGMVDAPTFASARHIVGVIYTT